MGIYFGGGDAFVAHIVGIDDRDVAALYTSVDIAVEPELAIWDMAALDIIVREAGGRFTNLDGVDGIHGGNGLSTNGALHTTVVEALKAKG